LLRAHYLHHPSQPQDIPSTILMELMDDVMRDEVCCYGCTTTNTTTTTTSTTTTITTSTTPNTPYYIMHPMVYMSFAAQVTPLVKEVLSELVGAHLEARRVENVLEMFMTEALDVLIRLVALDSLEEMRAEAIFNEVWMRICYAARA
jgi:hypothetical protein